MLQKKKTYSSPKFHLVEMKAEESYAIITDSLDVGGAGGDEEFGRNVKRHSGSPWEEIGNDL